MAGSSTAVARPRRGEVWHPTVGSEIRKTRPAVVVQNDNSNRTTATTIVAPVTSRARSRLYPNEALVRAGEGGCRLDSIVLARQIRCVDQARLVRRLGKLRPLTAGGGRPGIAHHTRSHRPLKGSQTSGSAGRGSAWLCVDTPGRKLRANRRRFVTAAVRRETAPRGELEPSSPTRSRALDMAYGYSVQ